jgi:hypothetical protein
MAVVLISLGIVELAAGFFKIRYWIFLRGERRTAKELGEYVVFRRRKVAGIVGVVLGVITFFYGNF